MSVIDNPYAPPQANLSEPLARPSTFFVVAPRKLVIMTFLTQGFYSIYRIYKQWACYRQATGARIWPVARAFFSLIFLYQMVMKIRQQAELAGSTYQWSPRSVALALIVIGCLPWCYMWVLTPLTSFEISMCLTLVSIYLMTQVQGAVNALENEPKGEAYMRLTWVIGLWIVIGLCMYAFTIVSALRPPVVS